jgi:hypothetical protein
MIVAVLVGFGIDLDTHREAFGTQIKVGTFGTADTYDLGDVLLAVVARIGHALDLLLAHGRGG